MVLYKFIQYGLISIAILLIGYQLILVILALVSKKNESLNTEYNRSFLVIVPCHNRGQFLSKTLYSLSALIYPWNLSKLVVLADNCTDDTVEIAQKFGVKVLERHNNQQAGNNSSMEWALKQVRQWDEKYDAIVIIKTGSLISSNFLQVMNYYLEKGSEVIQSSNLLLAGSGRKKTELIHITHLLHNYMYPLGHKALGFNMHLSGNGMCFRSNILMKYPFGHHSIDKEREYNMFLRLKEIPTDFAPEARIWTPLQSVFPKSKLSYIFSKDLCFHEYAKPFLKDILTKRPKRIIETLLGFITPSAAKLILGISGVLVINVILWVFGLISTLFVWIWLALAIMEGTYIFTGIVVGKDILTKLNGK